LLLAATLGWIACGGNVQREREGARAGSAQAGSSAQGGVDVLAGRRDDGLGEALNNAGAGGSAGADTSDAGAGGEGGQRKPEICSLGRASCTSPGCGVHLDQPDNCGACGAIATPPAHAVALCGCSGECPESVCAPGFANCDRTSDDCETSLESGGSCTPTPTTSWCTPGVGISSPQLAMMPDGSLFVSGVFDAETDFDPSPAVDLHRPEGLYDRSSYVSKFNGDGSYAWTKTWSSAFGISRLRPGGDGSLAVIGYGWTALDGTNTPLDLDPTSGVDLHGEGPALVKLDTSGAYVWGRTWAYGSHIYDVAFDSAARVYAVGLFSLTFDADPGPGTVQLASIAGNGDFMLSLDTAGEFRWARSTTRGRCYAELNGIAVNGDQLWVGGALGSCTGKTDPEIELPAALDPTGAFHPSTPFLLRANLDGVVDRALSFPNTFNASVANVMIGSAGDLYASVSMDRDTIDFDPGPGVAQRLGTGAAILSLSNDGTYRWVRMGGDTLGGVVSPAPNDGVLVSDWQPTVTAFDSAGNVVFSMDTSRWSAEVGISAASSAAGFVVLGENKAVCATGYELQRYAW